MIWPDGGRHGSESAIAYSAEESVRASLPFACETVVDAFGEVVDVEGPELELTGRPLYLLGVHTAGVSAEPASARRA